jgi:superfamily I DNA/RNA helicase
VVDGVLASLGYATGGRSVHDAALLDEAKQLIGEPPNRAARAKAKPRIDTILERVLADMELLPSCPVCGFELTSKDFDWLCTRCDPPKLWRAEEIMAPVQVQQLNETIARVNETYGEAPAEEARTTWGHVLVDEAQQLTPMQWRMLSRRCPTGSFTIVGDLNQGNGTSEIVDWSAVGALINEARPAHVLTLEVNYRTPSEIMDVATVALRAANSPVEPPRSVRSTGERPTVIAADTYDDALQHARSIAADRAAATPAGTIVIVVPADGAPVIAPEALDERVVEMGVEQARGLEFDDVIVVEPSRFEVHDLYVALTRATARLTLVHAEPLPDAIGRALSST